MKNFKYLNITLISFIVFILAGCDSVDSLIELKNNLEKASEKIAYLTKEQDKINNLLSQEKVKYKDLLNQYNIWIPKYNELLTKWNELIPKYNELMVENDKMKKEMAYFEAIKSMYKK